MVALEFDDASSCYDSQGLSPTGSLDSMYASDLEFCGGSSSGSIGTPMDQCHMSPAGFQQQQQCSPVYAQEEPSSWKNKSPRAWSKDDVTLWMCSLMQHQKVTINLPLYFDLTGLTLVEYMTSGKLTAMDSQNGHLVCAELSKVLADCGESVQFSTLTTAAPMTDNGFGGSDLLDANPLASFDLNNVSFDPEVKFSNIKSLGRIEAENRMRQMHQHPPPPPAQLPPPQPHYLPTPPLYPNPWTQPMNVQTGGYAYPPPVHSPGSDGSMSPGYHGYHPYSCRYDDMYNDCSNQGNHLWEFVRDLLFDTRYNPSLVKWEDREEGVFKFVKSDQVAKLWGRKKNNPNMTYEKLSRAMRYYYKRNILEKIEGRRLVYKFGSMATGWKP